MYITFTSSYFAKDALLYKSLERLFKTENWQNYLVHDHNLVGVVSNAAKEDGLNGNMEWSERSHGAQVKDHQKSIHCKIPQPVAITENI